MKRAGLILGAVILLTLTGCTQTINDPPATELAETSAPLVAESPAADAGDEAYLSAVREGLPADTVIPNATDEQLLEAGARACEEIAAGTDTLTLSLIEGEEPNGLGSYDDSSAIIIAARAVLCD